ncbi:hypothetical protein NDU88_000711 [Pleurodeles waltl]|uniref:C-type lectin domain-containing protein n=1 Tax=Pleurodeles waltl TaxID=8319 RepID=A0AAV7P6J1_PLEWA|nr:hypothetical protein NDU88_000711 [Pleurodeles waltl]
MGKGEKSTPAAESTRSHGDRGSDEGLLPALENGAKDESKPGTAHKWTGCCKPTTSEKFFVGLTTVLFIVCLALIGIIAVRVGENCTDVQNRKNDFQLHWNPRTDVLFLAPCPDSWIWIKGKCYNFLMEEENWETCNAICSSWNSTLAVIEDTAELDILMNRKGTYEYWIGLSENSKSVWTWVDGNIFSNWFPIKGDSDCAYLNEIGICSSRCYNKRRCLCSMKDDYETKIKRFFALGQHFS